MDSSLGKVKTRTVAVLLLLAHLTFSVNGKLYSYKVSCVHTFNVLGKYLVIIFGFVAR